MLNRLFFHDEVNAENIFINKPIGTLKHIEMSVLALHASSRDVN